MLEDLLFNPFMFGVVYPLLGLGIVTSVLILTSPTKPVQNTTHVIYPSHIYVSSTWAPKKIDPYKRTVREEPAEAHPIFDEMEAYFQASEAKLKAALDAHKILFDLGQDARNKLALCS